MSDKLKRLDRFIMKKARVMQMTGVMDTDKLAEEAKETMKRYGISDEEILNADCKKLSFVNLIKKTYSGLKKVGASPKEITKEIDNK